MAEEKEPERKKLSLQGNKKLSLGGGQDFIKSNRNNNIPGTRSVQVETRRKRIVRGGIKQNLNFEGNKFKLNQINSQTNLTEREREARMNALKHGLQDIESKSNIKDLKVEFLGWYLRWDPQEAYYYASRNCGYFPDKQRTDGTYGRYSAIDDKMEWYKTPFPCNEFWDKKAWYWLEQNVSKFEGDILFWNIGGNW